MKLSTVILPHERWSGARATWQRAEALGFHAAYTYDHLSWRSFRNSPWFDAVTTLAAAAGVTERIRLGPLVTSPNFRHPVPLAKAILSLDDLSQGRLVVGIGSGGGGFDATVLGGEEWSARERSDRFSEFVERLDQLLTREVTNEAGPYYPVRDAVRYPEPLAVPRPPFVVGGYGPKALAVVATHGEGWVTYGAGPGDRHPTGQAAVADQIARLDEALAVVGRSPESVERLLLDGLGDERPLVSLDAFVDMAGRYREIGITEIVLHWPIPDSLFAADQDVFERIAVEGLAQLGT
jgi:alkanesulfonate monooxygenase SsuD/methylene tetrahydromethanopterin reductase-like flavin-dependent oxidoreductase (luciferase family)